MTVGSDTAPLNENDCVRAGRQGSREYSGRRFPLAFRLFFFNLISVLVDVDIAIQFYFYKVTQSDSQMVNAKLFKAVSADSDASVGFEM